MPWKVALEREDGEAGDHGVIVTDAQVEVKKAALGVGTARDAAIAVAKEQSDPSFTKVIGAVQVTG